MRRTTILFAALSMFTLFTAGECRKALGVDSRPPTEPPPPAFVVAGGTCSTDATVPLTIFFRDESRPADAIAAIVLELFNPVGRPIDSRPIEPGARITFNVPAAGVYRIEQTVHPLEGGPIGRQYSCEVPVPILGVG